MAAPHFIVHDKIDSVGVVVVEGVKRGQIISGWIMENNRTIKIKSLGAIPIGHKVALAPLQPDDTVVKYGHDIGRIVQPVKKGGHVHVHNLKTKRW
ncbi:MAG: SAF domain-containing protein [Proteobacteria bacterium]|nr:SAF domain-containing protein [Pseudomonadota bacterium]